MNETSPEHSAEQIARRFGATPPSPEEISAFEDANGFGAYERCRNAERRARLARRMLQGNLLKPNLLERQGLPSTLAVAYCKLLYGPPLRPARRLYGAKRRKTGG